MTKLIDKAIAEVKKIENPYPLDLVKNPKNPSKEGKYWMFGNRVFENTKANVIRILEELKREKA